MRYTMTRARMLHLRSLRAPGRWSTAFGSWVGEYTSLAIVRDLGERGVPLTRKEVYEWLACRGVPRPTVARALVAISGGRLTLEAIYSHPEECAKQARAK